MVSVLIMVTPLLYYNYISVHDYLLLIYGFHLLNEPLVMQLTIEGGSAVAIFVRCFVNKNGIEEELERRLHVKFPRGVLAAISVILWIALIFNTIIFHIYGCIFILPVK